jgi:hypothetical protein
MEMTGPTHIGLPMAGMEDAELLSHAEIDAVLDDPTMSADEKAARLEELRERVIHREDEEYAPFTTRIMDALSMLAQGGHDYTEATPAEKADEPSR